MVSKFTRGEKGTTLNWKISHATEQTVPFLRYENQRYVASRQCGQSAEPTLNSPPDGRRLRRSLRHTCSSTPLVDTGNG